MRKTKEWIISAYTVDERVVYFERNRLKEVWVKVLNDGKDWFLLKENIKGYKQFNDILKKYIKDENKNIIKKKK